MVVLLCEAYMLDPFGPESASPPLSSQILLHQISHGSCSKDALAIEDVRARAEAVLENADTLDCRKFVSANDIVKVLWECS